MKGLAELILSLCDLAEAEGRALRKNTIRTGSGCVLLGAAILFVMISLVLILCAGYELLILMLPRYAALLFMAALGAIFAILLFWRAQKCLPMRNIKNQSQD